MKKHNQFPVMKSLTLAVSTLLMTSIAHADTTKKAVGDLEIYKAASGGNVTLTMMLDISGSMLSVDKVCSNPIANSSRLTQAPGTTTYYLEDSNGNRINSFERIGKDGKPETVDTSKGVKIVHVNFAGVLNGRTQYFYCDGPTSRMEKLKEAMIEVVRKHGVLDDSVKLGVGTFPTQNNYYTGQIAIPAKELTTEHRWELMKYISTLMPVGSTPAAQAYVEAGAYMLGTKTANLGSSEKRVITVGSMDIYNSNSFRLLYCGSASNSNSPTNITIGSVLHKWYWCNDSTSRQFPPFDHDMTTQTSSWLATINPNRLDKLDFNLFPKFDVVYGLGNGVTTSFPATAVTNDEIMNSANGWRNPNKWRNSYGQFASAYHFGRIIDFKTPSVANSGFPYSDSSTKKADGNTYQSPIGDTPNDVNECDGYGIYFLTDGEPNWGTGQILTSANLSLNKTGNYSPTVTKAAFPDGQSGAEGYWNTIASYSKDLYTGNNPLKAKIQTAAVGFGSSFTPSSGALPMTTKTLDGKSYSVVDCDKLATQDAKNLCRLGGKGYGYGNGGFLATSDTAAVSQSVKDFVDSLKQEIPPAPTGVISIPEDPYSISSQQATAYLPVMEAKSATSDTIWPGNMKKYAIKDGTPYGQNQISLYKTDGNGTFNTNVQDLWSQSPTGNDDVRTGGFYAQLVSPNTGRANVRAVYVEDWESDTNKKPILRKFGVDANGKITLDGRAYSNTNSFADKSTYSDTNIKYLLKFLGFESGAVDAITNFTTATLPQPTSETKVLGASPHSAPALMSYQAKIDVSNRFAHTDRQDYLIFGSMDGALHMVNDADGREKFAFIPKVMLQKQPEALENGSKAAMAGVPKFGVDAPWRIAATYGYRTGSNSTTPSIENSRETHTINGKSETVTVRRSIMEPKSDIYAYGGLRMGGDGLYALNLGRTSDATPSLAFALTPESNDGFGRLGQIWAKPTKVTIMYNNVSTDVLIFGGGYDMCYENEAFQVGRTLDTDETYAIDKDQKGNACSGKTQAIGNAIYMVNAETGDLLWSASNSRNDKGANATTHTDMNHSIVAEINTIDRNGDGNVDAIYFADLGGQIFRADATSNSNGIPNRVTRLLKDDSNTPSKYARRFYEKPVLSVYQDDTFNDGNRFVLVNAISGDRSNPTSKMRTTAGQADRVYGIMDVDIGKLDRNFYGSGFTPIVRDADSSTLFDLSGNQSKNEKIEGTRDSNNVRIPNTGVKSSRGWYYPLSYFDGYANVKYTKGVGKSEVIGSLLFSSVYNPDKSYNAVEACSASVIGGSEYQMYCLPFGVCLSDSSTNGRGGFLPAGQGISELTLGPLDDTATGRNRRVLISSVAVNNTLINNTSNRVGYGEGASNSSITEAQGDAVNSTGGDGSMPLIVFDSRYTMKPLRWYDNSIEND